MLRFSPPPPSGTNRRNDDSAAPNQKLEGAMMELEDATRMKLTAMEQKMARQLKAAAKDRGDLRPLSDWDCAWHAIVSMADHADAKDGMERIRKMQDFQTKYGIQSTLEDGLSFLRRFFSDKHFAEVLLKIDRCVVSGGSNDDDKNNQRYFAVIDMAALIQCVESCRTKKKEGEWKTLLGSIFYLSQCLCPHMDGLRGGCTLIFECGGVDWSTPTSMECLNKLWLDLSGGGFPVKCKDAWFYNASPQGANAISLLGERNEFTESMMSRMYVGCQMEVNGKQVSLNSLFSSQRQGEFDEEDDHGGLLQLSFNNQENFCLL